MVEQSEELKRALVEAMEAKDAAQAAEDAEAAASTEPKVGRPPPSPHHNKTADVWAHTHSAGHTIPPPPPTPPAISISLQCFGDTQI